MFFHFPCEISKILSLKDFEQEISSLLEKYLCKLYYLYIKLNARILIDIFAARSIWGNIWNNEIKSVIIVLRPVSWKTHFITQKLLKYTLHPWLQCFKIKDWVLYGLNIFLRKLIYWLNINSNYEIGLICDTIHVLQKTSRRRSNITDAHTWLNKSEPLLQFLKLIDTSRPVSIFFCFFKKCIVYLIRRWFFLTSWWFLCLKSSFVFRYMIWFRRSGISSFFHLIIITRYIHLTEYRAQDQASINLQQGGSPEHNTLDALWVPQYHLFKSIQEK